MHQSSLKLMESLLIKFGDAAKGDLLYDVGSCDVNGTYRPLAVRHGYEYAGIDIAPGSNVDAVVPEHDGWLGALDGKQSDVTVSGQCLEHTRWPWQWIQQVNEITKKGGLVIIIAPWKFKEHRFPVDCWRILPDGMEALFEWAGLETLEAGKRESDCWGVGRKLGK